MATEVRVGKELTERDLKVPEEGVPILALYFLPEKLSWAFVAYNGLTVLLQNGVEVEKFLTQKIGDARRILMKMN